MADPDKVINGLYDALRVIGNSDSERYMAYSAWAIEDAIALLKAQEPRVMTLEEVRGLPPLTPVYVEEIDDPEQGIHITEYINQYVIDEDNLAGAEPGPRIAFCHYCESPEDYGSYWRCWTARPTNEQRRETPWD